MSSVKILLLAADPTDQSRLRVNAEFRDLQARIRSASLRDSIDVSVELALRLDELQRCLLAHQPTVLHFSGHGSRAGALVVEDHRGESVEVPPAALQSLLSVLGDNLQVVVLNSCFSDRQAEGLLEAVDFVVAMSDAIGDESAVAFAAAFYEGLAFGRGVRTSFELGKTALLMGGLHDDFQLPQLHVRAGANADEAIVNPL